MHIRKIRNHAISAAATLAITWTATFSAFAATVALALCVTDANAATLAPTTAHDDIPGDATLKEIVEGAGATEALEAEAKERKAADETETAERKTSDKALQTSINEEVAARKVADEALQTNVAANASSIASEADARKAADEAETKARDEAVSAETTARKDADAALVGSLSGLSDALTAETNSRIDADNGNAKAVSDEATARENADKTLQGNIDAVSSNLSAHVLTKSGNPHGVTAADVKVSVSNGVVSVNGEKSAALDAGDGRGIALGSATNLAIVAGFDTNTLLTVDGWEFSACQNSNYGDPATGRGANQTNIYASVLYPDGGRILTDAMIPTSVLGVNGSVKKADEAEHAASADTATTAEGLLADDGTRFLKYTNADDDSDSDDEDWAWRIGYTTWYDSTTHTNVSSRLVPDGTDFVTKKTLDAATLSAAQSAAQTAITAATNGLVTASVTNGLASAASVKANADAIAAEREARESAGYLTAEADPVFAAWTNGSSVVAGKGAFSMGLPNGVTIGYAATNIYGSVTIGPEAFCGAGVTIGGSANGVGVTIGDSANGAGVTIGGSANGTGVTIGGSANGTGGYNVVIGESAYNDYEHAIVIGASGYDANTISQGTNTFNISTPSPAFFWFNSVKGSTARTLQSYLDERVPWRTFTNSVLDVAGKSSASEKKYPLFIIRLNEDAASPKFSDIELKATTNNYATFESMTFFAGTAVNGLDSSDYGFTPDWCRIYVLSSKVDGDVRRWRRIRNTTDLGEYKPGDFAIIVDPAMFRRGQGDGWCGDQNEELTWSFVRLGSGAEDDAEKDAYDGTSQLWRPIMPVKWYSKLPAWADQDEYGAAN